jgi:hypothetical protein
MSASRKPALSGQEARELIAEVRATDRKAARQAIRAGVQMAPDQWLEAPLIAEALTHELVAIAENGHHGSQIAEHLRDLAAALEGRCDLH